MPNCTSKNRCERCKEKARAYGRAYYRRNRDRYKNKPRTEAYKQYQKAYHKLHPWLYLEKCARRRAAAKQATPKWVDRKALLSIYKNCPKGFHVDHIIPLNGVNVSGLHVPYNLQYLPAMENIKKGNKIL